MRARLIWTIVAVSLATVALGVHSVVLDLTRARPARVGPPPASLVAQPVAFPSQSGAVIHGWLSRAREERGSVLLLPGVRSNRLSMVRRALFLHDAGYATLLIDFQATGESEGTTITFGWLERFDVLASVAYLREHVPGPVAIIGVSLGGAAALLAAPPLRVEAAVIEAVYPSIDRAVINRLRMRLGVVGPLVAPLLLIQLQPRLGIKQSQLRPVDHVPRLECPLLVIGGAMDRHTTLADTQLLFDAARQPKELWILPEATHSDFFDISGGTYRNRVLGFLQAAFSAARRRPN